MYLITSQNGVCIVILQLQIPGFIFKMIESVTLKNFVLPWSHFFSDETRKRVSRCQLSSVTTSDLIKNDKNYVRRHPHITSAHFWTFPDPPTSTLCQQQYNTQCQQKLQLFEPTHPVLCWRNIWMVPNLVETISISSLKFCLNLEYVL